MRRKILFKNYYNSILIQGDLIIAIYQNMLKKNIVRMFPKVKNKVHIIYRVDIDNFNLKSISNSRIVNQSKLLGSGPKPTIIMASRPKCGKVTNIN